MISALVIGAIGVGGLFVLLFLPVPVWAALVVVGFAGNYAVSGWDSAFALLGTTPFDTASIYSLLVVPLFIITGGVASTSGLSADLFKVARVMLSGVCGGLSIATICESAYFGAVCGSSIATAATMTGMDRLIGPPPLQQVRAYPSDIGLAAASAITSDLIVRYPKLRIAFSHGGGTLGLLLPRLAESVGVFPAIENTLMQSPTEQARRLYYDGLVFDGPTLAYLAGLFGTSQIMLGIDYPFNFHDRTPVERVEAVFADPATRKAMVRGNALGFLGRAEGEMP